MNSQLLGRIVSSVSGLDLNKKDENGNTTLHIAAKTNQKDCLMILIRYGADINVIGEWGRTPLHVAAGSGSYE